ncbi:unnamed protein product, partial [Brassica rapa]
RKVKTQINRRLRKSDLGVACGKRTLLMKTATTLPSTRRRRSETNLTGAKATLLSSFSFVFF